MFFIKFGKFLAIISSNSLPALFSLFFSETPIIQMLAFLTRSQKSLKLSSFLKIVFSVYILRNNWVSLEMRIWSEQSRLNLFRDSLCGQILGTRQCAIIRRCFRCFFLSFLPPVFGYLFKFLSLRERLSFDFRCKSTTSNSQNLGVKLKKCIFFANFSVFRVFLYKIGAGWGAICLHKCKPYRPN